MIETLTIGDFKVGKQKYFSKNGGSWYKEIGYSIRFGNKYYAYNSFNTKAYLSNKRNSEIFSSIESAEKWMIKYNLNGKIVYLYTKAD